MANPVRIMHGKPSVLQKRDFTMFDHVTIIHVLFAGLAVVFGLCSRSILAALVAGIFLGLIHAGLVVLEMNRGVFVRYIPL